NRSQAIGLNCGFTLSTDAHRVELAPLRVAGSDTSKTERLPRCLALRRAAPDAPVAVSVRLLLLRLTGNPPVVPALGDAAEHRLREITVGASNVAETEVSGVLVRLRDLGQSGCCHGDRERRDRERLQ